MLKSISIRDYVIVETLDLEFDAGLTVFTGETGTGKSILIDALSLALGGRADVSTIRHGATRSEVSASFDLSEHPQLYAYLEEQGLTASEEEAVCLLRRLVDNQGKSRAFINGSAVTLTQLKEVSQRLINIHGQHAHQTLQLSTTQRQLLDDFAGHQELVKAVTLSYHDWQQKLAHWQQWQSRSQSLTEDVFRLTAEIKELEEIVVAPPDWLEFNDQHSRLTHAQQVLELNQQALAVLSEGRESALDKLEKALSLLHSMPYEDMQLKSSIDLLQSSVIQVDEVITGLRHFIHGIDIDDARLSQLDEHMSRLMQCARRYRVNPEDLWQYLAERRQELSTIELLSDGQTLEREQRKAHEVYRSFAQELTLSRQHAALKLADIITQTLVELAMGEGSFVIEVNPIGEPGLYGQDQIVFKISGHAKQAPQEIAKVASGGELSRISLAIQTALSQSASVPTLIFDEVDTGIGGRVAQIVGRLLKGLGNNYQVLCVTHLPQVASCGDHHLRVMKKVQSDNVVSHVEVLNSSQRVEEIARMLGGVDITAITLKHAQEMLQATH
ncbi:MAG: DNA repair protein RecN [Ferrovum sp. 37-45-19]|nr:MAG: DNA repair protein RecN [Ferrovum sp. 21-44-67]OYV94503.1 MAG: DNA repair protein RecN [Ferrovum sp. 37-45-19]OZB33877.1 MAG: DNA repair protein RecN [Ferrovum sp. 34-44-207]HQT81598.1 DNA repair protein RecN [Ferrovaceae bacterium]HQU06487.1 DNA repair protein RecN [Ferrovaceae bacterium]